MYEPNLLGGLPQRRRVEATCATVEGAAELIMKFAGLHERGAESDDELRAVNWVTVSDLESILAAVALRASVAQRRQEHTAALAGAKTLPGEMLQFGVGYTAEEFVRRFTLMRRSIEMFAEGQQFDEAWDLAERAAAFVLTDEADADPFLGDLAAQLLWTMGGAFAREDYFFDALQRFLHTCELLQQSDTQPADVTQYAVATADRCINLIESGTSPRSRLLDAAAEALALVDGARWEEPTVLAARFEVAKRRGDRRELAHLASLAGPGVLDRDWQRVADLLSRLSSNQDWQAEFGPFAPAVFAHCHDLTPMQGFARFDGADAPPVPTTGAGYRSARLGHVTFAEQRCDEITSGINTWLEAADEREDAYLINGASHLVRRTVPTAAMHTLVPFASRSPADIPDSVRFLMDRGSAATVAEPELISTWIDRTLGFLDGGGQHEASFTCAGILVGAAQALLPVQLLRHYISALEVMPRHDDALRAATHGEFPRAPITTGEDV
jgi:hypothetical protein